MIQPALPSSRLSRIATLSLLACALSLCAGAQVSVSVDLQKPINILTDTSLGYTAAMFTGDNFSPAGVPYLHTAGITTPRYPGNHGIADLYHWSTKSLTPYKGIDAGYLAPESNFGDFAQVAEKLGSAVIVVNYGSDITGKTGGSPAEAAAWVAYANGDPADAHPLGKDAAGTDWKTIGYWATLRASAPIGIEDGYNFLRINHPKPFGFKLWQVGDQLYNNGYLGGDHTGNPDLHGPAPTALKDFGKLKKDASLSPATVAENIKLFVAAMKAVDPTIQIGIGLNTPPAAQKSRPTPGGVDEWNSANYDQTSGPEWNSSVLKAACSNLDFVSLDWETGNVQPPDYKVLDEASLFPDTRFQIASIVTSMLDQYKGACSAGHVPRIALSLAQIKSWPHYNHPVVKALWIADTYALLVESGFLNTDWAGAYGDSMMSSDHKKFGPAFYGLQMLHIVAHNPGDALIEAISSSPTLSVHATRRRDGILGLMLVNTDPKLPATIKISLKNGSVGTTGKRFDYGSEQFDKGAAEAATPLTVPGNDFTITVAPYTITDLLLPLAK
jgi:hypothetical protein